MEKIIDVSQEQKEYAIDLLVTLVVEELEKDPGGDPTSLLSAFVASKTGALLYDESSLRNVGRLSISKGGSVLFFVSRRIVHPFQFGQYK